MLAIQGIQGRLHHCDQDVISFSHRNFENIEILKLGNLSNFFPRYSWKEI